MGDSNDADTKFKDEEKFTVQYDLIILAAGYGTRLNRDLEADESGRYQNLIGLPKALLPIDGVPLIERWLRPILRKNTNVSTTDFAPPSDESGESSPVETKVGEVYIVTNHRFAPQFYQWLSFSSCHGLDTSRIRVIDNKTVSNDNRNGAIADLDEVFSYVRLDLDQGIDENDSTHFSLQKRFLVMASDLLFDESFELQRFLNEEARFAFHHHHQRHCALKNDNNEEKKNPLLLGSVLRYDVPDSDVCRRGILEADTTTGMVRRLLEKPSLEETNSRWACPAFYVFSSKILDLTAEYLQKYPNLHDRDAPGRLIGWVLANNDNQVDTNQMMMMKAWTVRRRFDVGNLPQYVEADEYFRESRIHNNGEELSLQSKEQQQQLPLPDILSSSSVVTEECYARIALVGNPSDGFGGKTLSTLIGNFKATVTIEPLSPDHNHGVILVPNSQHDSVTFRDLADLNHRVKTQGYYGGIRLLKATCKKFYELVKVKEDNTSLDHERERHFRIAYSTTIPRSVGLSGSSAIVVAAFRALMKFHGIRSLTDLDIPIPKNSVRNDDDDDDVSSEQFLEKFMPQVILDVENKELGISAGLQDRVVQWYGGLVFMNFSSVSDLGYGRYERLPAHTCNVLLKKTLKFYLAYDNDAGGESGVMHKPMHQRFASGEAVVVEGMQQLAANTQEFYRILLESGSNATGTTQQSINNDNDIHCEDCAEKLTALIESNFEIRCRMYGDSISPTMRSIHRLLRDQFGLASKFSGSGGAFVCCHCTRRVALDVEGVRAALRAWNFTFVEADLLV